MIIKCPKCGRPYVNRSGLHYHLKQTHGMESGSEREEIVDEVAG